MIVNEGSGDIHAAKGAIDLINKPMSGCVSKDCDSLLKTRLLQVVKRLIAS